MYTEFMDVMRYDANANEQIKLKNNLKVSII